MEQKFIEKQIGHSEYKVLLAAFVDRILQTLGDRVVAVVLHGSVARGTARPDSDVDLLLILKEIPNSYCRRLQPFLPILRELRGEPCWKALEGKGLTPFLSLLVLSLEEATENRLLYLDMIEEAIILVDRGGFFRSKLAGLRQRLEELGAKKIQRGKDWYWDLKPDLKPGEAVTL